MVHVVLYEAIKFCVAHAVDGNKAASYHKLNWEVRYTKMTWMLHLKEFIPLCGGLGEWALAMNSTRVSQSVHHFLPIR